MNVKRIVTLLVLVVCVTAIAAVPAFATTTNQVSILDLAVALSASDEFPPDPWMFTEGSDFGRDPSRKVLDAWGRPVYLDVTRQAISQLPNGDFIRITDWVTGLGDEDMNGDPITVPDYEIWGPAYRFPSDGNEYTFGDPLPGLEMVGRGPHGGYTTTSAKCVVCHSAHNAAANEFAFDRGGNPDNPNLPNPGSNVLQPRGYALLRQGSTGCEYCHLTGSPVGAAGMSSRIVYTSGAIGAESNITPESGHAIGFTGVVPKSDNLTMNSPLSCSTCHAVHGNFGTWQPREFFRGDATVIDPISLAVFDRAGADRNDETVTMLGYRMLRTDPGRAGNVPETGDEDPVNPATDQDQVNQFTLGTWCMSCHNDTTNMDRLMTGIRSIGLEDDFEAFEAFYENRLTAFVVDSSDVHSDDFVSGYDGATILPVEAHATSFEGVYSGPGQCYTCHRGDLGGPLGEEWRWTTAAGEVAEGAVPINADGLARLRALGYFALDTNLSLAEQQAQLNQNLTCSGCHFGSADYALWASRSDWPHSSPSSDRMLLGMDLGNTELGILDADPPQPGNRATVIAQNFCSRCHVNILDDADQPTNSFLISRHFVEHSDIYNTETEGTLGQRSPGNPLPTPPAP